MSSKVDVRLHGAVGHLVMTATEWAQRLHSAVWCQAWTLGRPLPKKRVVWLAVQRDHRNLSFSLLPTVTKPLSL